MRFNWIYIPNFLPTGRQAQSLARAVRRKLHWAAAKIQKNFEELVI